MVDGDGLLGWATGDLVRLDAHAPGLISRLLTTSPATRHAALLVLAHRRVFINKGAEVDRSADKLLASVLRQGRPRDIIEQGVGAIDNGLMGALARLAPTPFSSADSYIRLRALFRVARYRRKADAFRHIGQITENMLLVADALDPRWAHRETLSRIEGVSEALAFNAAVVFIQQVCSHATDEVVADAIARLQPATTLATLLERFVRRADRFPAHPIAPTADLRPLASTRDLIEAGRRLKNCLHARIEDALIGRAAYAEFRQEWIVEFRPLSGAAGWIVWEVHAARNARPARAPVQAAIEACLAQGVPSVDDGDAGKGWLAYRNFTSGYSGLMA